VPGRWPSSLLRSSRFAPVTAARRLPSVVGAHSLRSGVCAGLRVCVLFVLCLRPCCPWPCAILCFRPIGLRDWNLNSVVDACSFRVALIDFIPLFFCVAHSRFFSPHGTSSLSLAWAAPSLALLSSGPLFRHFPRSIFSPSIRPALRLPARLFIPRVISVLAIVGSLPFSAGALACSIFPSAALAFGVSHVPSRPCFFPTRPPFWDFAPRLHLAPLPSGGLLSRVATLGRFSCLSIFAAAVPFHPAAAVVFGFSLASGLFCSSVPVPPAFIRQSRANLRLLPVAIRLAFCFRRALFACVPLPSTEFVAPHPLVGRYSAPARSA